MPHLHLSSLVTKKKIETGVIFFHSTSRLCTYPYLAHLLYIIKCVPHCPVHTAAAPDPTDAAAGKTDAAAGKTGTPTEHPRRLAQHPPPAANHPIATTPNVGAPFMTPVARQGETTGEPNTSRRPAQHPRLSVRPTSCRLRAAAGVINGAPTTRRHQDNPTGRNHRRMTTRSRRPTQHPPPAANHPSPPHQT